MISNNLNNRLEKPQIDNQFEAIVNAEFVNNIFNSLPHVAAVLNQQRQVIFANQKLIKDLGLGDIKDVLGARPGELLMCEHAHEKKTGCGTSKNCRYCGALNVMLTSQKENRKVESECTIVSEINGETINFEFGIVINPFEFRENTYYILSLFDISHKKRLVALERIFFHDVMNKVGSLNGFIDLIKGVSEPEKINEYIGSVDTISRQLTKEIIYQKQLLDAENGTLMVNEELIESLHFLDALISQISNHQVAKKVKVILEPAAESITFLSDSTLLGRVLLNMLKNAVEASLDNGLVRVHCRKSNSAVLFEVNNSTLMPPEIQAKVFKKSFSTKDVGRGLGTYSMKLLTEKYLMAKIYFKSTKTDGTTFTLEIKSEYLS